MRTAILHGITHKGESKLICGRTVPLPNQLKKWREEFRGKASHPEFKEVTYQESDGIVQTIHLRSPEAQAKHDAMRETEAKAAKEAEEARHKAANPKPPAKAAPKPPAK